jgi:hypothetical protein
LRHPAILCALTLPGACLGAQSPGIATGTVQGQVRCQGRTAHPPAVFLILRNTATGETRKTRAGGQGFYAFPLVAPGTYGLAAEAEGFAPRRVRDLQVRVGSALAVDLTLEEDPDASLEVVADASATDPQRTRIASVIDPLLVENLPIDRRRFQDFSLTVPGVSRSGTPVSGAVPNSGLSFRGMDPRQNRFLVDGLDNNDLGTGGVGLPVNQDAVKEFQVITGALPAEFGRAAGGAVNTVLKGGGNTTSGSFFAFRRPGSLDAKPADGSDASGFRQDQYGATVGGPLIADRLFYFVSAERYRKTDLQTVSIDPAVVLPILSAKGFQVQNGPQAYESTETTGTVKLDFLPDDRNRWGFRLSAGSQRNENQIPWGGIIARTAGGAFDNRNLQAALSHQWLGGESWVNEARLMYAKADASLISLDPQGDPSITIQGDAQFGTHRLTPQDTETRHLQFTDTATFSLGDHTLKAGVDLLHSWNEGTVGQNLRGVYVFQDLALPPPYAITLPALTAFANGVPAAYIQSWGDPTARFSADSHALFLQDDWQLSPRFLFKAGLRFERERLPAFDGSAYADLQTPPATSDPTLGPIRLPDGAVSYSSLFSTQDDWSSSRLSPRLSFSWQARDPLRIYGGFGIYSGSTQLGSLYGPLLYNNRNVQTCFLSLLDPGGAALLPTAWAQPGHRFASWPAGGLPLMVIPGSYRMPETRSWNLGFEWVPGPEHRFTLDLLRSRGSGFMNVRDVNAYVPYQTPLGVVYRRPDLRYSQILRLDGSGESRYWGQTLGWQWRVGDRLALALSYTHGKAENNYTDWAPDYAAQDTFDPSREWGPSPEDQTHQVQLTVVCRTRSTHPLLRDTTVAVTARYASGYPYSQLAGSDLNHNGDGTSDRPAGVGRNSERGPATRTVDLRLARAFPVRGARLDLILEVLNLFDASNVVTVQNVLTASQPHPYGSALTYGPPRQVQFCARVAF